MASSLADYKLYSEYNSCSDHVNGCCASRLSPHIQFRMSRVTWWLIIHTNRSSLRCSHFQHPMPFTSLSSNISPFRHIPTGCLSFIQLLVLPNAPPAGCKTKHGRQCTPGNDYSATSLISRLLRSKEEVRREPVRDGRDTVGYSNQRSSLCSGPGHDGGFPRDLYLSYG